MPTSESSLSVAVQATADFLAARMADDVVVTVDAPQRAQKQAEDANTHVLNIFVYRIAPSGFHADMGHEDATFIRANVLLTAFPAGQGDPPPDSDLRVLGQAVRVLQSFPVIPTPLPGAAPANAPADDFRRAAQDVTKYELQAVLQAPTMEELNHIWTTQGGELAYRLSSAYELALIPIEPLTHATPAPDVQTGEIELGIGSPRSPFQMFVDQGRLFSEFQVAAGTAATPIAIIGAPKSKVRAVVQWQRNGGNSETQAAQDFVVLTPDINTADALFDLDLSNAAQGDVAHVQTVLLNADDEPVEGVPPANAIHLTVGA